MTKPGPTFASEQFAALLAGLRQPLRSLGFRAAGQRWTIASADAIGLIEFQRSRAGPQESIRFTVNVGVRYQLLASFFDADAGRTPPKIEHCHWHDRIGFLMPERHDHWWTIDAKTDCRRLIDDLGDVLRRYAVPAIMCRLSREELLRELRLPTFRGATTLQRLMYLSVAARDAGDAKLANDAASELEQGAKGRPWERTVEVHLRKLAQTPKA